MKPEPEAKPDKLKDIRRILAILERHPEPARRQMFGYISRELYPEAEAGECKAVTMGV